MPSSSQINFSKTIDVSQIHIDVNYAESISTIDYPELDSDVSTFKNIISTLLAIVAQDIEIACLAKPMSLSVYLVESEEGRQLNHDYRHKDYATNVLSFPSDLPAELTDELSEYPLGELIICLPVVKQEAQEQNKLFQHHFVHLLVHGCLHLLGYDHELSEDITELDAQKMESLEIAALQKLDIPNPYIEMDK